FAILDEPDSGIDIDSLRLISKAINIAVEKHNIGVLLITHYNRILYHVKPHLVHVMIDGEIKKTGGAELAHEIEAKGYQGGE
ncbi:MAG: Fe-S cluster assembly ATPase SufC, partial [Candidatus Caldarchaeales archaeon]